jgi:hypothetical protein
MTPTNYLCRAAREAKARKANYVIVVRDSGALTEGTDLQAALKDGAHGATLYFFCEPALNELILAKAAGVKAVYYGVSKHDAGRYGLYPPRLKPEMVQRARETILKDYVVTWNHS